MVRLVAPVGALREELRLLPATAGRDGSPAWMIHDPVANRFYRIGWADFEMLARWHLGSRLSIAQAICDETTLHVEPNDVESLEAFLARGGLLRRQHASQVDSMRDEAARRSGGVLQWLLHHYLFLRVPLVRPQDALATAARRAQWIFTPAVLWLLCATGLAGLALLAHQWDTFAASFVDHLTWRGAVGFACATAVAKLLHELGHALTATRFGVRVGHMGVAFVVMFPMLYTDTSESWKLRSARQRLAIASAGIVAELALAGIATLAWVLVPDGAFRTAMFFLASTSWVLTLFVNASPFMRFDGYFILCDLLDFPNLHERAGAFARVALRRAVPGIDEPWPEAVPATQRRWLIAFAMATWCWRLSVFLGIAVLVYVHSFKALGIVLMLVELTWFIGRPVQAEVGEWWRRRQQLPPGRKAWGAGLAALLLLLLAVPWHGGVHGTGTVRAARQHIVFSPRAGRIDSVPTRSQAAQGELLFSIASPDLSTAARRAEVVAEARSAQLVGLGGLQDGEERRASIESDRARWVAEAGVFSGEQSRMQLSAPFAGELVDLDPALRPGVWVQPREPLAMLIDPRHWVAEIFVAEQDVDRVRPGDGARVLCDGESVAGRVLEVDADRTAYLPYRMLDATSGGPFVTVARPGDRNGEHAVRDGIFRVRIALDDAPPRRQMMTCTAAIASTPRSLVHGLLDHVLSVLVRESGF